MVNGSTSSNGNMHLIGSHLYASLFSAPPLIHSTMYFFFFYFVTEITPLSILLLSTYIRTDSRKSKPRPEKRAVATLYEPTSPRSSYNRHAAVRAPSVSSAGSRAEDVYPPVGEEGGVERSC